VKNIKALRKGFFVVVFLLANIASNAFCIEPSPAQRVSPSVIQTVINCPSEAQYSAVNIPAGWNSNLVTMWLSRADISTSDELKCFYKHGVGEEYGVLFKKAPAGSCKVNSDNRSFICVQKLQ